MTRTGWHRIGDRRIFVLPERTIGDSAERVVLQTTEREPNLFTTGGTLEEWREQVARLAIGNTRLAFAISCGFAAPLLELLGEDGGGFHLRGISRLGKTTLLRAGASVCGGVPGLGAAGFVRGWRATGNGIEAIAGAHSDCLLPLDEMGQVDGREAGEIAYMLANGAGKSRAARSGVARPALRFRVLFLSTGEIGLADKLAEANRTTQAGMAVRLVDVPADAGAGLGVFEYLHDEASAGDFAQLLLRATTQCYGTALPAFLARLTGELQRDASGVIDSLRERVGATVRASFETIPGAGGQVRSVANRFALVAIAGELAGEWQITEWQPGEATRAAETCFRAWLADRGTVGAAEDAQAVKQLRAFIATHGAARFERWDDPRPLDAQQVGEDPAAPPPERFKTMNRAGWRRWVQGEDGRGQWVHYLTAAAMKEAMVALAMREATRTLATQGFIVPSRTASDTSRGVLAGLHTVPGHGKVRLYEISRGILGAEDGTD